MAAALTASRVAPAVFGFAVPYRLSPQPFTGYETLQAHESFPPGARRFDLDGTLGLMTAVGHHPQTALLHRAMSRTGAPSGIGYPKSACWPTS